MDHIESQQTTRTLYLDLLMRSLLNTLSDDPEQLVPAPSGRLVPAASVWERGGRAWLTPAHTMIGRKRLRNIQFCLEKVIADGIAGDAIETGVWRGGATIFMRGILKAHGITDRLVWVADSFEGLPPPDPQNYPADAGLDLSAVAELAVPLAIVRDNFARCGLLDEQVRFLKGYLEALDPKLTPGGFVVVDDYNAIPPCKRAVHDYLGANGLAVQIRQVDWTAVHWRKPTD